MIPTRQSFDFPRIARDGLRPRTDNPQRVIVVGAGMSGLVAAYELLRAGHDALILEARHRVGGRVLTLRAPFTHGLYGEAGAMRIPRSHDLSMAYVDKLGLEAYPFTLDNPRAFYFFNCARHRIANVNAQPNLLSFDLADHERGKTAAQLWKEAIQPLAKRLHDSGGDWGSIIEKYDRCSLREFLQALNWSQGAMDMFGLLLAQEAMMNASIIELLREEVGHYFSDLVQIDGGMDTLPRAFLPYLHDRIRFGAEVTSIDQDGSSVTIRAQTLAGQRRLYGDYAILTVPFPVLLHIEMVKPLSPGKRRAVRQLHYESATKIFLQSRRRFWEQDDGIFGGVTVTDLPVRNVYYPEHGRETGRGVLLASYTWSGEARRWGALAPRDRIVRALNNVAQFHPQVTDEFEAGASVVWDQDQFAGGAFVVSEPGQEQLMFHHIAAPEGRLHFAGEHTSHVHAWIQGAIESGLRAASEIHRLSLS